MAEGKKTKIRMAPGQAEKRRKKRERVAKALFSIMVAVEPEGAPDDYDDLPNDELEEFEKIVDGIVELWDALNS